MRGRICEKYEEAVSTHRLEKMDLESELIDVK